MRSILKRLDVLLEYLGIAFLGAIVLVVTGAVLARVIFDVEQRWTEQLSVVLMIWLVFLGIAVGFRERSHTSVEMVAEKLSDGAQTWVQRFTSALVFAFGLFLVIRGLHLTAQGQDTALYVAMPISGFMTCVYITLQVMGVRR